MFSDEQATNPIPDETLVEEVETEDTEIDVADEAESEEDEPQEPELVEIEIAGKKYKVDPAIKDGFMMHADYTRKTQEVAENRRALEAERKSYQERAQMEAALQEDFTKLKVIDAELEQFRQLDWQTLQQSDQALAQSLLARYTMLRDKREAEAQKTNAKVEEYRGKVASDQAARVEKTKAEIAAKIPGWNDAKESELRTFAASIGFDDGEVKNAIANDSKIAHVLNLALLGQQVLAQRSKPKTATAVASKKAEPMPQLKGRGAPQPGPSDRQSTDDWMKARNRQLKRSA